MSRENSVLVTGSRGVLGSELKKQLELQGYTVIGTRRPEQTRTTDAEVEIAPYERLHLNGLSINAIIHLAGEYRVNVDMESIRTVMDSIVGLGCSISQLIRDKNIPVIVTGSYFEQAPGSLSPWSYYSQAKELSRQLLMDAANNAKVSLDYVYLYDNYGAQNSRGKFIDLILNKTVQKEPIKASEGMQVQDLTHISDVVEGIIFLLRNINLKGERISEWQIRSRQVLNLREIEGLARKFLLSENRFNWGELPYRTKEVYEIWNSASDIPGWSPKWTLESYFQEIAKSREL